MAKVLLVDDDAMAQWALDEALTDAGHCVLQAATGVRAGELIESHPDIDVVVTDIDLAGPVSGLQLARFWRARSQRPTVFTTGFDASAVGILGHDPRDIILSKPFRADDLIALVERLAGPVRQAVAPIWRGYPHEKRAS